MSRYQSGLSFVMTLLIICHFGKKKHVKSYFQLKVGENSCLISKAVAEKLITGQTPKTSSCTEDHDVLTYLIKTLK